MEEYRSENYKGCTISWKYDDCPENPREWTNISHMICWHGRYSLGDSHSYETPHACLQALVDTVCTHKEKIEYLLKNAESCGISYEEYNENEKEESNGCLIVNDGIYNTYFDADSLEEGLDENLPDILDIVSGDILIEMIEQEAQICTISMYDHGGITLWLGAPSDPWDSGIVGYSYVTKRDILGETCANEENWKDVAWQTMESEMQTYDHYVKGEVFGYEVTDEQGREIGSCWGFYGDEEIENEMPELYKMIDNLV